MQNKKNLKNDFLISSKILRDQGILSMIQAQCCASHARGAAAAGKPCMRDHCIDCVLYPGNIDQFKEVFSEVFNE